MTLRVFGAIQAAGIRIEEQEGQKQLTPGALGWAGYPALFEKGPVGEVGLVTSRAMFDRVYGGIIEDGVAPDACRDYFSAANGAGGLALVRVTDGNEEQASLTLYCRHADALTTLGTIKAKNGGRWGGKQKKETYDLDSEADITNTTLQLPAAVVSAGVKTDEWKGGYIELEDVANSRYEIIGNTSAGLLTVASDQTMRDDMSASPPTELRFYLVLENDSKAVSVLIDDGGEDKSNEFSIKVLVDGAVVKTFENLHVDPDNARYWVDVINNAGDNYEIEAEDLFTGAYVANVRPANHYGKVLSVALNVLTIDLTDVEFTDAVVATAPTVVVTLGTTTDVHEHQVMTCTFTSATAFDVVSDRFGSLGSGTTDTEFTGNNKYTPPFTITADANYASGDIIVINYKALPVNDALAGGYLYPNKVDTPLLSYRIIGSTHKTITVASGTDLTAVTDADDEWMVAIATELSGGIDGNADIADTDYSAMFDVATSPFNDLKGRNLGLIKYGCPGVTATAVQQAGVAYAEAKNHQYRVEVPAATLTETGAIEYVNDTIGRSDYMVCAFPSWADVTHPDPASSREGKRKTVSLTGKIHGREARIASDYLGYHKAAAGVDAILSGVLALPTGNTVLNGELLNPVGIAIVQKKAGNFVVWGDRTCHRDSSWRFKHKRELMSYYEHVFEDNFDWVIFTINDSASDADVYTAFLDFFTAEFAKRAIRGDSLVGGTNPAAIIKVDAELNTDAVRANGDKIAEVSLRLADTTERFIIRIGQQGVFEDVA